RGEGVADADGYDLGQGAGFYVNATQAPWSAHYRMYDYVVQELPAWVEANFPASGVRAISGHSMGGHGALVVALRNPGRYRSVSTRAATASSSRASCARSCCRPPARTPAIRSTCASTLATTTATTSSPASSVGTSPTTPRRWRPESRRRAAGAAPLNPGGPAPLISPFTAPGNAMARSEDHATVGLSALPDAPVALVRLRSEEHTSELQS